MLNASEVIANVESLTRDYAKLRDERDIGLGLFNMRTRPRLPKDLARDAQVNMLSPELIDATSILIATISSFPTEIQELPLARTPGGAVPAGDKRKADNLEQADAVFLSKLHKYHRLRTRLIGRMANEPLAIVMLETTAIDSLDPLERFPYRAYDIDLDGTGWTEREGEITRFGWRYKQIAAAMPKTYGRSDSPRPGQTPYMRNGKVEWAPISDEYSALTSSNIRGRSFEECEMLFYDDGEMFYHVALNQRYRFQVGPLHMGRLQTSDGEIVWMGQNPFGRVSAFIAAGNETWQTKPEDHYLSYLMALRTTIAQENMLRTMSATRSRNAAAPRDYEQLPPDVAKTFAERNIPLGNTEWEDGKTPRAYGEIKPRPQIDDRDADRLREDVRIDKDRYRPTNFAQSLDQETIKVATAAGISAGIEAGNMRLSPLVRALDALDEQLLAAFHHCVSYMGDFYEYVWPITGKEIASTYTSAMKSGTMIRLDAEALDFEHRTIVTTKQRTTAQTQLQTQIVRAGMEPLPDGSPGPNTREDLMQAAGITDPTAQNVQKTREMIVNGLRPVVLGEVRALWRKTQEIESGINLAALEAMATAGTEQAPQGGDAGGGAPEGGPNLGNAVHSPITNPVEGGSGPTIGG